VGFFVLALLVMLVACDRRPVDSRSASSPITLTDDAGVTVQLARPASRVISLIPSVTDGIFALDASGRLAGRSTTDRVPPDLLHLPIVGDGLNPSVERVVAERPDLVVLWAGDKRGDLRRQLEAAGIATLALAVEDTTDALRSIALLGTALGIEARADSVVAAVRGRLDSVGRTTTRLSPLRVFYLVASDPPMTVGPATFIDQLLGLAAARNVFRDADTRWPSVSLEQILARDPDVVVLPTGASADAAARLRAQPGWRDLRALANGCVVEIDADLANRPGPTMGEAAAALAHAFAELRDRCGDTSRVPRPAPRMGVE
jgi:ABC-type Fe3+-hydroxamate transport system substrate-binding protein